jgi:hypothetical protein
LFVKNRLYVKNTRLSLKRILGKWFSTKWILLNWFRTGSNGRLIYNMRMSLRERGWESVDLIHLAQNRNQWQTLVNTVMNLRVL